MSETVIIGDVSNMNRIKICAYIGCSLTFCLIIGVSLRLPSVNNYELSLPPLMGSNISLDEYMYPLRSTGNLLTDKYTVVMPTYRRNDVIQEALGFHCSCRYVDRIIVVWNNVHETVPKYLTELPCNVEIIFKKQIVNSLNNRFKPFTFIRTECVLIMDDDRLQEHEDMELGFKAWKNNKHLLVGFQPYIHKYNQTSKLYYLEDRPKQRPSLKSNNTEYSIILTTSVFINVFYLNLYTTYIPTNIRMFVETKFNGEDIVLNFMVARHLRQTRPTELSSCLWVEGSSRHLEWDAKRFRGINHVLKNFHAERNQLLNDLVKQYGEMALNVTDSVVYRNTKGIPVSNLI